MPSALTYPGVYVEEIPSGVRTITGVATSITAFIGRARRGPVNVATVINSFADYERQFGGLWLRSSMSFAVRDFFVNGGQQAVIVRLFTPATPEALEAAKSVAAKGGAAADGKAAKAAAKTESDAIEAAKKSAAEIAAAKAALAVFNALPDDAKADAVKAAAASAGAAPRAAISVDTLKFLAANEGAWGANLRVEVDGKVSSDVASTMNVPAKDLFNLAVFDLGTGATERFLNVTLGKSTRRVDAILEKESQLLRWDPSINLDTSPPALPDLKEPKRDALRTLELDLAAERAKAMPDAATIKTKQDALRAALDAAAAAISDGNELGIIDFLPDQGELKKLGLHALEQLRARDQLFNLLCIPPYNPTSNAGGDAGIDANLVAAAASYCEKRRAMLLVDPPAGWKTKEKGVNGFSADPDEVGTRSRNAALFFPRVVMSNPLRSNLLEAFPPCGIVAGVFARTDVQRGVWKAPAGIDAALAGVSALAVPLTDEENGELNPLGVNCLRSFPVYGRVLWGSRTLRGADQLADEYKYVPVRRTALYIEESLYRGLKWVVFEPNDEPLWAQIRLNVGAFMHGLFRLGAFQGKSPRDAYFVKCDSATTTQTDINLGIVNILVGFAPLKPAEFVVIKLQQIAGQIEV